MSSYAEAAAAALAEAQERKRRRLEREAAPGGCAGATTGEAAPGRRSSGDKREPPRQKKRKASAPAPAAPSPAAAPRAAAETRDVARPRPKERPAGAATHPPSHAAAAATPAWPAAVGGAAARVRQQKALSLARSAPASAADVAAAAHAAAADAAAAVLTKRQKLMASVHMRSVVLTPAAKSALSFDSDWHDHCETPFEAYRDVEPLLFRLATTLGKTKETLRIYDPYYCEGASAAHCFSLNRVYIESVLTLPFLLGSMVAHLGRLGFSSVHNVNEDCYETWRTGRTPSYDVLITNPPYSADHMPRILAFCAQSAKPWMLLLPNFVAFKKSFKEIVPPALQPAYLVPPKRYVYYAPGRQTQSTQATSPFDSFWYICFRSIADDTHDGILEWWERKYAKASGAVLARNREALPPLVTPVREEKRANPKARRRAAKRAAFLHAQFGVAHAHVRDKKGRAKT